MTKARDLADTAGEVSGGDTLGTVTGADLDLSTGNFFEVTTDKPDADVLKPAR
jgi:hypothetical protein